MGTPVSIIIPVFNQVEYTRACLSSLLADSEVKDCAEIIVIDNCSTDGTPDFLRSLEGEGRQVKLRAMKENTGYSRACNAGAEIAEGDEFVFLNNDTIPEKGWLSALRNSLRLPKAGLVGPKLLYPGSRTVNSAGYVFRRELGAFYHIYHNYPEDFPGVNRRREFQAVLGACLIVNRSTFSEVEGISDFGYDDIDLCLKIRAKGYKIIYEPRATVLHHGSITLRNSPPGSIPMTDTESFGKRWPRHTIEQDDDRYYREDGLCFVSMVDGIVNLRESISEAMRHFELGVTAREQGQLENGKQAFQDAISCYLGYEEAYQELILLYLNDNDLRGAIHWAHEMSLHTANQHRAQLTLASLLLKSEEADRGRSILGELLSDWTLTSHLRDEINRLL